ncbi:BMP family protein [Paenibacillus chartarius]|uniref:BMP family protein n=1 Tax=Paenibacillus chartarius TaxID=747481 RepID=A0ABV6DLZ6_9BACL
MRFSRCLPFVILLALSVWMLTACSALPYTKPKPTGKPLKIGLMLADYGLGDQSYNDAAFRGLTRARDELGIVFDYREPPSEGVYEQGLLELIEARCDLVVAVGFSSKTSLERVAVRYPAVPFLLVDETSELPNVSTLTFKEEEGSYLAGIVAGLKTSTNTIGFIGGIDVPVINKFEEGFEKGARAANPKVKVLGLYGDTFGDPEQGRRLARTLIDQGADVLYAAAGLTGSGVLRYAEEAKVYSIGVDSDQFTIAERSVLTSMLKHIDVGLYVAVRSFVQEGSLTKKHIRLGLRDNGVSLAPLRLSPLSPQEREIWDRLTEPLLSGAKPETAER